jgi:hypothetical protein
MNRDNTLFCLRYAVRVHERRAKLWDSLNAIITVTSLLSGSAAIAAIASQNKNISLVFGVLFAFSQAIEYGLRPATKSAESKSNKKLYSAVLLNRANYSDQQLEQAYEVACDRDEIIAGDAIKSIAYNDVAHEVGAEVKYFYQLSLMQRFIKWLS